MKKFPEWVPDEVIKYYWSKSEPKEYTDEYDQLATEFLCRALESEGMKKAWRAIAKRSESVHPGFFAAEIFTLVRIAAQIPWYPSQEETASLRKLATKVRGISSEFEDTLGHCNDEPLMHWFGANPVNTIDKFASNMERFTNMVEDHRNVLKQYVGKPNSQNAKRTFIIRYLSERVTDLYHQPLHDVVASITSVLIDESVDPELVRKLVSDWTPPQ